MKSKSSSKLGYASRYAWVDLKRLLRLPTATDKRHFSQRFFRAAAAGKIHAETVLTGGTMKDGLGSQALCRMSVEGAAMALGLRYAYNPITTLQHSSQDDDDWSTKCERALGLPAELKLADQINLPHISMEKFVCHKGIWEQPHLVIAQHMYGVTDLQPLLLKPAIERMMRTNCLGEQRPASAKTVALHLRRGDVSQFQNSHRFQQDANVIDFLKDLSSRLSRSKCEHEIVIVTNEIEEKTQAYESIGWRVQRGATVLDDLAFMVSAPVLCTAPSSLSYLAGLLNPNTVIYQGYQRPPMPGWLVRDSSHSLSDEAIVTVTKQLLYAES